MRSEGYSSLCVCLYVCLCICLLSAVHKVGFYDVLRPCERYILHAEATYRVRSAKNILFQRYRDKVPLSISSVGHFQSTVQLCDAYVQAFSPRAFHESLVAETAVS